MFQQHTNPTCQDNSLQPAYTDWMSTSACNNGVNASSFSFPVLLKIRLSLISLSDKLWSNRSTPAAESSLSKHYTMGISPTPLQEVITTIESKDLWKRTVKKSCINHLEGRNRKSSKDKVNPDISQSHIQPQQTSLSMGIHHKQPPGCKTCHSLKQSCWQEHIHSSTTDYLSARQVMQHTPYVIHWKKMYATSSQGAHLWRQRGNFSQTSLLSTGITLVIDGHLKWSRN